MKKRGRQTGKERFTIDASLCGRGDLLKAPGSVAHYLADRLFNLSNDIFKHVKGIYYMQDEIEPKKTLWMLICNNGHSDVLTPLYATSEQDAEEQAQQWMKLAQRSLVYVGLRAYPMGFRIFRYELLGNI